MHTTAGIVNKLFGHWFPTLFVVQLCNINAMKVRYGSEVTGMESALNRMYMMHGLARSLS